MINNKSITIGTECHYCSCIHTKVKGHSYQDQHISYVAVVTQYLITLYLYT